MSRRVLAACSIVIAALLLARASVPASPWTFGTESRGDVLANNLQRVVDFDGFDDPKTTLGEALDKLAKDYDLTFDVCEAAFKYEMLDEVLKKEIASPTPIPPMKRVPVEAVLRKVLSRITANSGATTLLRPGHVEVTTNLSRDLQLWGETPLIRYPVVHLTPTMRPLEEWLTLLAEQTGENIYLDPMIGERGRTPVGVRMYNVPVDVAVHLLASGAGLKTVEVANVLCVTDKEHVSALQAAPVFRLPRADARRKTLLSHTVDGDPNPGLALLGR